jgi:hypothetical protein
MLNLSLCYKTFILHYLTYFSVYLKLILFAGYELSHNQPAAGGSNSDNFKPYRDILSEDSEFSVTTKSEQCDKRMSGETKYGNSTSEGYSHAVLLDASVSTQDPYSHAGIQKHNVNLPQSALKSETVHIPIPVVSRPGNLEASVPPIENVKPTKPKLQMEQRVCIKFKKTDMFWIC